MQFEQAAVETEKRDEAIRLDCEENIQKLSEETAENLKQANKTFEASVDVLQKQTENQRSESMT